MSAKVLVLATVLSLIAPSNVCQQCKISDNGLALTKSEEGYYPYIYKDPVGYDTIGFGHLVLKGEKIPQPLLGESANNLLKKDMSIAEKGVNRQAKKPLFQTEFDALADFFFNVGESKIIQGKNTIAAIRSGDYKKACNLLLQWNKAAGKTLPGLTKRRKKESEMCNSR